MFFSVRAFEEKNSFFFCKRRGSSACICLHLNATGEDMRFPAVALDGSFSFFFASLVVPILSPLGWQL